MTDDPFAAAPDPAPPGSEAADADAGSDAEGAALAFEADLDTLLRERDDLLDTTRRLQADFENYRKRVLREQTALVERAHEGLLEQLLPVLDSFELAVANLESSDADPEKVRKGIELVYAELFTILEKAGLARVNALGAAFDPNVHEAVMQDGGEGEPVVDEVFRPGWTLKGRVLRPAMVKVVHRPEAGQ